jgi:hypothetical protein
MQIADKAAIFSAENLGGGRFPVLAKLKIK